MFTASYLRERFKKRKSRDHHVVSYLAAIKDNSVGSYCHVVPDLYGGALVWAFAHCFQVSAVRVNMDA
jgi:hypothetical protein